MFEEEQEDKKGHENSDDLENKIHDKFYTIEYFFIVDDVFQFHASFSAQAKRMRAALPLFCCRSAFTQIIFAITSH